MEEADGRSGWKKRMEEADGRSGWKKRMGRMTYAMIGEERETSA